MTATMSPPPRHAQPGPAPAPRRPTRVRRSASRQLRAGWGAYTLLGVVVLISVFPVYWTFVAASNTTAEISRMPPTLLPGAHLFENIDKVFGQTRMALALANSLLVASTVTASVVFTSTLAGFALAKLRFRGRKTLLALVVATLLVPPQLGIIPLFIMMAKWFGLTNNVLALILPAAASAFGVFFMRQYLITALPTELLEAGRIDGCSTLRLYWHMVLPAARPAAAVLGMLTFLAVWNDFFWPLVVMTPQNPTVQVALSTLAGGYIRDYSLVLAGALVSTLPVLLVFILLGRYILDGIMEGAVKA